MSWGITSVNKLECDGCEREFTATDIATRTELNAWARVDGWLCSNHNGKHYCPNCAWLHVSLVEPPEDNTRATTRRRND